MRRSSVFLHVTAMGYRGLLQNSVRSRLPVFSQRYRGLMTEPTLAVANLQRDVMRSFSTDGQATAEQQRLVLKRSDMEEVEQILHHKFNDRSILAEAMTHKSLINCASRALSVGYEDRNGAISLIHRSNERLELVGDKVFGLLVAHVLYKQEDNYTEGEISNICQTLVTRKKASQYCKMLGLDKHLMQEDVLRGGKGFRYGDFFEALLGALFLDGGVEAAGKFFRAEVVPTWSLKNINASEYCNKQALQEYLVSQGLPATALGRQLKYVELKTDFREQVFTQGIELFGRRVSIASGPTKVSAGQAAAGKLLETLQRTKATCLMIRMARQAKDKVALEKLQATRAAQVNANMAEGSCSTALN